MLDWSVIGIRVPYDKIYIVIHVRKSNRNGSHLADFERKKFIQYYLPLSAFHSRFENREKGAHISEHWLAN
jgi:hypothetical protein